MKIREKDEKLKSCPFCGGKPKLIINSSAFTPCATVKCENCSAKIKDVIQSIEYCAIDEAVKLWNQRTEAKK